MSSDVVRSTTVVVWNFLSDVPVLMSFFLLCGTYAAIGWMWGASIGAACELLFTGKAVNCCRCNVMAPLQCDGFNEQAGSYFEGRDDPTALVRSDS